MLALQAELKHMHRLIGAAQCPIEDLDVVGDDLMKWRFKIRAFDDTTQGGNDSAVQQAAAAARPADSLLKRRSSGPKCSTCMR